MDKNLRNYIREVLTANREARLDELDEALTNATASREFVETKLGQYRDSFPAVIKFADWEDAGNVPRECK